MRKSAVVIPLLALAAGIAGFFIRRTELATAFETATGFAKRGAPITVILIVVSAAVLILAAVAGILVSSRMKAENDYSRAFKPKSFLYLGVSVVLGVIWLAADVMYFIDVYGKGTAGVLDIIFVFLAAASAFSVIFLSRGVFTGRGRTEMMIFSVVPSLFFCFWLILLYKNNAANPVILSFAYQCLAIAAAALSYYFSAGFVYRKAVTGKTVFSFIVTIFFCTLVLADHTGWPLRLIYGLTVVGTAANAVVFIRNLKPKREI